MIMYFEASSWSDQIWCSVWQLAWKWFVIHVFEVTSWTTGLLVWHSLILAKLARKWVVVIFVQNQNTIWQCSLVWHPLIQLYGKTCYQMGCCYLCPKPQHNLALLWFGAPWSSPTKLIRKWVIVIHVQNTTQDGTPLICHSWIKCGKTC
jgi:hypothetical protein